MSFLKHFDLTEHTRDSSLSKDASPNQNRTPKTSPYTMRMREVDFGAS